MSNLEYKIRNSTIYISVVYIFVLNNTQKQYPVCCSLFKPSLHKRINPSISLVVFSCYSNLSFIWNLPSNSMNFFFPCVGVTSAFAEQCNLNNRCAERNWKYTILMRRFDCWFCGISLCSGTDAHALGTDSHSILAVEEPGFHGVAVIWF